MKFHEQKISYIGFVIVAMLSASGIVTHDLDIWLGVRDGSYDASALGQLYFPRLNMTTINAIGDVFFFGAIALIGYIIAIAVARHRYNNKDYSKLWRPNKV